MRLGPISLLLAPLLCVLSACGEEPTRLRNGPDSGESMPDAHAPRAMVDAARPPPIEVGPLPADPELDATDRTRGAGCPASSRWVVAVRGRVVDERGDAIEGAFVQPCLLLGGTDRRVCLRPAMSDAQGVVTAILPPENRCVDEVALRMLVPDSTLATGYCAVPEPDESGVLVSSRPLVLVGTDAPRTLPPVGDEAASRELVFDGVSLTTTPRAIGSENYAELAARVLDGALATETCLGNGEAMDLLVAFSPESAVDDRAGLPSRVEARGFSPGERVELFVLGGLATMLADGSLVPEAEWHSFATVTVGEDGTVQTPPGAGVPHLGWLGLRRAR
ncbi:MAG: hypothetical protein ACK6CU_29085 [Deltaproteobacteria bacterium]|jgi:hypothetical protein